MHYTKISDIQMAAMLCCAFSVYYKTCLSGSKSSDLSTNSNGSGSSPYNTIHNISEINVEGWVIRNDRTSSCSDSTDVNPSFSDPLGKCQEITTSQMLDPSTTHLYQCYMRVYADILHRWNLLEARAEVMKYVSIAEDVKHSGVELVSECSRCKQVVRESRCLKCSLVALNCVICNIGVRGSANACLVCGHGGHTAHLDQWFRQHDVCPTGCGCRCLRETCNVMER